MNDDIYFDNEDENIFSDEDISSDSPSKAPRVVSDRCMEYFLAWLARYRPGLQMIADLSLDQLKPIVEDFQYSSYSTPECHKYKVQDWYHSLQKRRQ